MEDVKKGLKSFAVNFHFPELKGGAMYQSASLKAGDAGTAVNRAFKIVRRNKGVKGHRITVMKISVVEAVLEKEQLER